MTPFEFVGIDFFCTMKGVAGIAEWLMHPEPLLASRTQPPASWRRATSGIAALFFAQGVEEESFPEGSTTRHRDSGAWKGNSFNKGHACIHGKGFRGTPLLHTLTKISNAHSTAKLLGHVLPAGPIAHCGSQRLKWSWGAAAGKDCRKSPYERH